MMEMVENEEEALYGKEYLLWKKRTLGAQVRALVNVSGLGGA